VSEKQAWFLKGIWVGALAVILVCAAVIGGGLATYFMLREQTGDAGTGTIGSGDSCTPTLPTTMGMSKVTPTVTPRPGPQIVIHVAGIVLDADQLPKEVPIADATVTVYNLRGVPADGASVRTRTDREGRFELWIPMKIANYPYWWGNIQVDASGYSSDSANVLCCSDDPSVKDCSGRGSCGAGTGGFYKIGLSRHGPTPTPVPNTP